MTRADLARFEAFVEGARAEALEARAGGAMSDAKSDLVYLVAGIVTAALMENPLDLRPVPERVDGVVTGRVFLEDPHGHRRLVIDITDADGA